VNKMINPRIPDLSGVMLAHDKIKKRLAPTPLLPLMVNGARLWCKCESEQPVRAFKIRGAWHRLSDMSDAEKARGVIAFSSGNHAQGVAWAAREMNVAATIVMPADSPAIKLDGTRALGADVILYDRMTESREAIAQALATERNAVLIPSFDDPWVVEGQGSVGLEVLEQCDALGLPAPDLVVTPCGGGGLASGLSLALPGAKMVIVEPDGWDDMGQSLRAGEIKPVGPNPPATACDALQTLRVAPLTFGLLQACGARGVSVSEGETRAAMALAWHDLGIRLEPGGAVALAALMTGRAMPGKNSLVLLSGGNVDDRVFNTAVEG
jgi:threonine dehydratase